MNRLFLLEADLDYSECYYESDTPEVKSDLREVSLSEAFVEMMKKGTVGIDDMQKVLSLLLDYAKNNGYGLNEKLEKAGYYYKSKIVQTKKSSRIRKK